MNVPLQTRSVFPNVETRDSLAAEVRSALDWTGGNVLGAHLKKNSLGAITIKAGSDASDKVSTLFRELGHTIDIAGLKPYSWYPAGYGPAILLIAAHLFSWNEKDVEDLGRISSRGTMLMDAVLKLVSVERVFQLAPNMWRKYHDFGRLIPVRDADESRHASFRVIGYDVHPISETYHKGYFKGIVGLVTGSKNIRAEVVKSIYCGDHYSEYAVWW